MRFLIVLCVVGLWVIPASAQDYDYETYRALDDISWELFQQRLDRQYPLTAYRGGGYFPVYTQPTVSKAYLRRVAKYQTRLQRAQANRAKATARRR